MQLSRVDHDVDLAADLAGQLDDGALVAHVQRHQCHLGQRGDLVQAGRLLPGLGMADRSLAAKGNTP